MQSYMSLLAITGALIAGAMSPGPSFLFVARNSIALSRNHGLATALGMGLGSLIFTVLALMGLQAIFCGWAACAALLFRSERFRDFERTP